MPAKRKLKKGLGTPTKKHVQAIVLADTCDQQHEEQTDDSLSKREDDGFCTAVVRRLCSKMECLLSK